MSGSKRERSLLNSQDRDFHNLPTYENNGQFPYADNYWYGQQPYWDPFMEQMLYNQYAAMGYYQPQYPSFYIPPTTPVSKTFANKPTTALTPAPLGRIIPQETISSALPVVPVAVPVPPRRTVAIPVPVRHHEPPPPHYYPRSPPSPYYHSRRPPPPHHYYDSDRLPHIRRRERYDERDYYDRYRHEDPIVNGYLGRSHDVDPHRRPRHWYQ